MRQKALEKCYGMTAVPKHCNKKVIIAGLHGFMNLSSNFTQEARIIRDNYIKAGYPFCFINSIIKGFNEEEDF